MNKKILLTIVCLLMFSQSVMASPLTDYSLGKVSLDLMYRNAENKVSSGGMDFTLDKKYNFEPSVTVGLGSKFALQYRNLSAKSGTTALGAGARTLKHQLNEFNILYSLGKDVSAFAGYVHAKATGETIRGSSRDSRAVSKNSWQVGLIGTIPIADKFSAYGVIGAGGNYVNCEVGLSCAFSKNVEFNVDYRNLKSKKFQSSGMDGDVRTNGFGFGMTCKL